MSSNEYGVETVTTVIAALLMVPLVLMGVLMPLMLYVNGGRMMGGLTGLGTLMPIIPLVVLSVLVYTLYTYSGGSRGRTETDSSLEELRSAYARGELSDEEFENRRDRLRSRPGVADGGQVSDHE